MIEANRLKEAVSDAIAGTDIFIVTTSADAGNNLTVELDSPDGIDLDTIARISRDIEAALDREKEDFSLEVGTAGLTAPFTVPGQYLKNIGNPVDVTTADGRKLKATLAAFDPGESAVTLSWPVKVKEPGAKRPVARDNVETIPLSNIKEIKYRIEFK